MTGGAAPEVSSVGRLSQLDPPTVLRIQSACNFVNAEVKRLRTKVINAGILASVGGAILYWATYKYFNSADPRFALAIALGGFGFVANNARKELAQSYKGIVVRRIVAALGKGLTYTPGSTLTKDHFLSMDLFLKKTENWKSEDEVRGRKNTVTYSLHEVRASRTEGSGRNRREVIIFRGIVARLDFNKNFQGHTVVVPDEESKSFFGLFGESESRNTKRLVQLENPDFERQFSVYSTNDQEARYLLTPKMMELVMEAQALLGEQVRLCFVENSVFCTIPSTKDRFEVSLFSKAVTPEATVGDLADFITLAERIVDTLELETRIWSRV